MMNEWVAVFIGGGLGSVSRLLISRWAIRLGDHFPWGTLMVNILACAAFALVFMWIAKKSDTSASFQLLALTGFCGGFSTFSTFSMETFRLLENEQFGAAFLYVSASIFGGLLIIWAIVKTFSQ